MLEISRLSGEPSAVPRIVLSFAAPEVRRIARKRTGVVNLRNRVIISDNIGGTSGGGRIFKGISRCTLCSVCANRNRVLHHTGCNKAHRGLNCRSSCLAGKLIVCRSHHRGGADCLAYRNCRRLYRIRMRLGADIDCANLRNINAAACKSRTCCLNGKGCRVFIIVRDGLFKNTKAAGNFCRVGSPHAGNLLYFYSITGNVCPVGYDTYHFAFLSLVIISCTLNAVQRIVI